MKTLLPSTAESAAITTTSRRCGKTAGMTRQEFEQRFNAVHVGIAHGIARSGNSYYRVTIKSPSSFQPDLYTVNETPLRSLGAMRTMRDLDFDGNSSSSSLEMDRLYKWLLSNLVEKGGAR